MLAARAESRIPEMEDLASSHHKSSADSGNR